MNASSYGNSTLNTSATAWIKSNKPLMLYKTKTYAICDSFRIHLLWKFVSNIWEKKTLAKWLCISKPSLSPALEAMEFRLNQTKKKYFNHVGSIVFKHKGNVYISYLLIFIMLFIKLISCLWYVCDHILLITH